MSSRIVIVSGGTLGDWVSGYIQSGDLLVGADRGALFLVRNGYRPALALGDFDSVTAEELDEIRQGSDALIDCDPVMKDWTDTEMAFNWALDRRPAGIVLLGALGSRFDHSLANVHLLRKALQHGIPSLIADRHNELRLLGPGQATALHKGKFANVSLLPLSAEVTGITLQGFLYPLTEATLSIGQSLGISNVIVEESGHVSIRDGMLLVIQSKDE